MLERPANEQGQRGLRGLVFVAFALQALDLLGDLPRFRRVRLQLETQFFGLEQNIGAARHVADQNAPHIPDGLGLGMLVAAHDPADRMDMHAAFVRERGLTNPRLAGLLSGKLQYPYPISSFSAALGTTLLKNADLADRAIASTKEARKGLVGRLKGLGLTVLPSQANFVLVSVPAELGDVRGKLLERGVAVRGVGEVLGYPNCLRVGVGTGKMNDRMIASLKEAIGHA